MGITISSQRSSRNGGYYKQKQKTKTIGIQVNLKHHSTFLNCFFLHYKLTETINISQFLLVTEKPNHNSLALSTIENIHLSLSPHTLPKLLILMFVHLLLPLLLHAISPKGSSIIQLSIIWHMGKKPIFKNGFWSKPKRKTREDQCWTWGPNKLMC